MLNFLRRKTQSNPMSYMEVKQASVLMERRRLAAQQAIARYKAAKTDYKEKYVLALAQAKQPSNDWKSR